MNIVWTDTTQATYQRLLSKVEHSTLLQTYPYAYAIRHTQNLAPRLGVIEENGKEIGFFQIHEASTLFGALHVITLDRGPLWFQGHGTSTEWQQFMVLLNKAFPKRFGRRRRFMPEWSNDPQMVTNTGWFYRQNIAKYQTLWLDLTPDLKTIRKNLKQKWRNALNKSEKQSLDCRIDLHGDDLPLLLENYIQDRLKKNYPGPSPKFLKILMSKAMEQDDLIIVSTIRDNKVIAMMGFMKHGNSVTYQVGYNSKEGRLVNAHHFLLWNAIQFFKEQNLTSLDLGGINPTDAKGVTNFKKGVGGNKTELIGQFG